ncbi:MAG: hypothetical protein ACYCWW_03210 [Deltaproteobacteria bacterium]
MLLAGSAVVRAEAPSLRAAIGLFDDFQDEKAAAVLRRLLQEAPTGPDAPREHVYLGLIALNALDARVAKREFIAALSLDPTVDLPFGAPPKARLAFSEASRELSSEPVPPEAQRSAPALAVTGQRSIAPSRGPAIVVGVGALAAVTAGAVLGAISTQERATAQSDPIWGSARQEGQTAGGEGLAADVLFGAAGVAAAAAIILFFVESPTTQLAVAPALNGVTIGGRF